MILSSTFMNVLKSRQAHKLLVNVCFNGFGVVIETFQIFVVQAKVDSAKYMGDLADQAPLGVTAALTDTNGIRILH